MAICRIHEIEGATLDQYDEVSAKVPPGMPDGGKYHVAGAADGRLYVVEVWESREDVERYMDGQLGTAIEEAGIPEPKVTEFEVHNEDSAGA